MTNDEKTRSLLEKEEVAKQPGGNEAADPEPIRENDCMEEEIGESAAGKEAITQGTDKAAGLPFRKKNLLIVPIAAVICLALIVGGLWYLKKPANERNIPAFGSWCKSVRYKTMFRIFLSQARRPVKLLKRCFEPFKRA